MPTLYHNIHNVSTRQSFWILWGHPLRDSMKAKGLPPHLYKSGGRWRRDNAIEEIKRLDALLEYAVQHNDTAEAERLREELRRLTESI